MPGSFGMAIPSEVHGDGRFLAGRRDFVPAYVRTHAADGLRPKIDAALALLESCRLCPRECGVNRLEDEFAVCRSGRRARVSSCFPHGGEEDVLRGRNGSGTIFFSWCNLRCVFCQNSDISQQGGGNEAGPTELAGMMIRLQGMGCHNINFVTPEHVVPQILEALPLAIDAGLRIPLVYNTSGYDGLETIRLLDGIVDIYMPDFKFWDPENCRKYLIARDYRDTVVHTMTEMHRQVGDLRVDERGVALRGVLVRHLVMPGMLDDSRRIMEFLAGLSSDTYVNLMGQYRPAWKVRTTDRFPEINRLPTSADIEQALAAAREAGLWRFDTRWRPVILSI